MTQIYPAQYVTTAVVEKPCYKALLYFLYLWKLFFFLERGMSHKVDQS